MSISKDAMYTGIMKLAGNFSVALLIMTNLEFSIFIASFIALCICIQAGLFGVLLSLWDNILVYAPRRKRNVKTDSFPDHQRELQQ